jgi:poly(3-hydroxybutyrate) depolymerase
MTFSVYSIGGRAVVLYTPPGIQPNAPLVITNHPGGSNALAWITQSGLNAAADAAKCYMLYTNGHGDPDHNVNQKTWWPGCGAAYQCCSYAGLIKVNDVEFIKLLTEVMPTIAGLSIDTSRIHLACYSNGWMLGLSCLAKYPTVFKSATGIAAAFIGIWKEITTPVNVPIMHIYGTADTVVPPAGGASSELDPYKNNTPYHFPALADWQAYLIENGMRITNVKLEGASHLFDSVTAALGAHNFASRVSDMVLGTGTWQGLV